MILSNFYKSYIEKIFKTKSRSIRCVHMMLFFISVLIQKFYQECFFRRDTNDQNEVIQI
jgi:hypothetical protein